MQSKAVPYMKLLFIDEKTTMDDLKSWAKSISSGLELNVFYLDTSRRGRGLTEMEKM